MAIRYRDRVAKLLDALKKIRGPEALVLVRFIEAADRRHEADQLSLSHSFDRFKDLVSWAKSSIDQE